MAKTREDWFLRGGERPPADTENECGGLASCQSCGSCRMAADAGDTDGDDGEVLRDWDVAVSRTRSVQQLAHVRVKAHSEEDAMDLAEDRAEHEAGSWSWDDLVYTEEYDDVEAIEAEVAR